MQPTVSLSHCLTVTGLLQARGALRQWTLETVRLSHAPPATDRPQGLIQDAQARRPPGNKWQRKAEAGEEGQLSYCLKSSLFFLVPLLENSRDRRG